MILQSEVQREPLLFRYFRLSVRPSVAQAKSISTKKSVIWHKYTYQSVNKIVRILKIKQIMPLTHHFMQTSGCYYFVCNVKFSGQMCEKVKFRKIEGFTIDLTDTQRTFYQVESLLQISDSQSLAHNIICVDFFLSEIFIIILIQLESNNELLPLTILNHYIFK